PFVSADPDTDDRVTSLSAFVPVRHADGRLECLLALEVDVRDDRPLPGGMRRSMLLAGLIASLAAGFTTACVTLVCRSRDDAERRLAVSERRLALAIDGADEGVWDWDLASGTMYLSDRLRRLLGVEAEAPEQFVALSAFRAHLHPDD